LFQQNALAFRRKLQIVYTSQNQESKIGGLGWSSVVTTLKVCMQIKEGKNNLTTGHAHRVKNPTPKCKWYAKDGFLEGLG